MAVGLCSYIRLILFMFRKRTEWNGAIYFKCNGLFRFEQILCTRSIHSKIYSHSYYYYFFFVSFHFVSIFNLMQYFQSAPFVFPHYSPAFSSCVCDLIFLRMHSANLMNLKYLCPCISKFTFGFTICAHQANMHRKIYCLL